MDKILRERTSPRDLTKSYDLVTDGAKYLGQHVVSDLLYDSVRLLVDSEPVKEIKEDVITE